MVGSRIRFRVEVGPRTRLRGREAGDDVWTFVGGVRGRKGGEMPGVGGLRG